MRDFSLPGRSPVMAANAAAATSHPLATATALSILREGGNAVDAAIAASATLCVVEPHMTGIGGDCFAIVSTADGSVEALNASGRSPQGVTAQALLDQGIGKIEDASPHAVTVPGALRGWEALHQRFGQMDWARLFADAVSHATDGFPVAPRVARDWQALTGKLAATQAASRHLLIDGSAPQAGDRFATPALGKALERIAREGASAFYEGAIAAEIAQTLAALGGFMSEADLADCRADWVTPVSTTYCGHDILEIPPSGQGITALILLKLLETAGEPEGPDDPARYHKLIELGRLAYAVRDCHVADPAAMRVSTDDLLSASHIGALAASFDPARRNNEITLPPVTGSDTVYLSVVDRDGLAISFINSLFGGFGSGIVTPQTGIALQNRGAGFVVDPDHPNCIGPAKRPLHTIIPGMVMKDGRPHAPFGVMGGAFQPMGHGCVLSNMLRHGMDPQQAIDHPRLFWDEEGTLLAESAMGDSAIAELQGRGHQVSRGGLHGGSQMIVIDRQRGVLIAGSDPRKDGHAAGY